MSESIVPVHETELVKTVEAETEAGWWEYFIVDEQGTTTNMCIDAEHAVNWAENEGLKPPYYICRVRDPRKPQPVPKIVIDWEAIAKELWSISHDVRKAVERHARIIDTAPEPGPAMSAEVRELVAAARELLELSTPNTWHRLINALKPFEEVK